MAQQPTEESMFWKCPTCGNKVDFKKQMGFLFDENGEAEFDPEHGIGYHTIFCGSCPAHWVMGLSGASSTNI